MVAVLHEPARFEMSLGRSRYQPPRQSAVRSLRELLELAGRSALAESQYTLLSGRRDDPNLDVYCAGAIELLKRPAVSIVGTREVSPEGRARATRLAKELVRAGVVVVSGLAKGVDEAAHLSAIQEGGRTVAVIGTPLNRAYPAENADLQMRIYNEHLLLSPFPVGERVFPSNFPKRNRVMAALSDASVIVEASDTSGTLHQAAECQKLGRWLFIMKSVADNPSLSWPKKFLGKDRVAVLTSTSDILNVLQRH